jgi:hypothetical protein
MALYKRGDKVIVPVMRRGTHWNGDDEIMRNVRFTVNKYISDGYIEMYPRLDTVWHIFHENAVDPA